MRVPTWFAFRPASIFASGRIAVVSGLLGCAVVAWWISALFIVDSFDLEYRFNTLRVIDYRDGVTLRLLLNQRTMNYGAASLQMTHHDSGRPKPGGSPGWLVRDGDLKLVFGRWGIAHRVDLNEPEPGYGNLKPCSVWDVRFPYWLLAGLTFVHPVAWIFARRRHVPAGHCRNCGYDLRATVARCPECGASPAAEWLAAAPVSLPSDAAASGRPRHATAVRWAVLVLGIRAAFMLLLWDVVTPHGWYLPASPAIVWLAVSLPLLYPYTIGPGFNTHSVVIYFVGNIVNCAVWGCALAWASPKVTTWWRERGRA